MNLPFSPLLGEEEEEGERSKEGSRDEWEKKVEVALSAGTIT